MIKFLTISILSVLAIVFLQTEVLAHSTPIMHWMDLGIVEQIQIITGVIVMTVTSIVASVIFRSVWIRRGYEGLDEKLEAKEVAMMLAHIISFICLLVFEYMITFNPYMTNKFPDYAFWICASGFVGPEVYMLINFVKKIKSNPQSSDHD